MDYPFYITLDSSQEYFVEDFLRPYSWEIWSVIFFFVNVFARFWYQHNVDLTRIYSEVSLPFQFSESLCNIGVLFPLNLLTEFNSEAIWGWFFLCWKVFNNYLKCFYKSIHILFLIISILAIYDFKQFVHFILIV